MYIVLVRIAPNFGAGTHVYCDDGMMRRAHRWSSDAKLYKSSRGAQRRVNLQLQHRAVVAAGWQKLRDGETVCMRTMSIQDERGSIVKFLHL